MSTSTTTQSVLTTARQPGADVVGIGVALDAIRTEMINDRARTTPTVWEQAAALPVISLYPHGCAGGTAATAVAKIPEDMEVVLIR
ncbi:hypothetical protein [Pseudonocardia sp. GCM10023141]|uniref:hypothetical protein n=1 Tax=Pseudonocardia sp. GCM10023141 TaxID=3252653 RepID=UPI00361E21E1